MSNQFNGELVLYAAIIAITLSKDLTPNEQNALGNFFQAIGQNLEVISCNNRWHSWRIMKFVFMIVMGILLLITFFVSLRTYHLVENMDVNCVSPLN